MGNTNDAARPPTPAGPGRLMQVDIENTVEDARRIRLTRYQSAKGSPNAFSSNSSSGRLSKLSSKFNFSTRSIHRTLDEEERDLSGDETAFFYSEDRSRRFFKKRARVLFIQAMSGSKLLESTSGKLRDEIFEQVAVPVFVKEGDVLFEAGATGHLLFILLDGKFKAIVDRKYDKSNPWRSKKSNIWKKKKFEAGMAVAEQCLFVNTPHEYTLEATTDGIVLAIHRLSYQLTSAGLANREEVHRAVETNVENGSELASSAVPWIQSLFNSEQRAQFVTMLAEHLEKRVYAPEQWILGARRTIPGLFVISAGQVALRAPQGLPEREKYGLVAKNSAASMTKRNDLQLFKADELEWLTRGDCFGEAGLISDDAEMGVDCVCSSDQGATIWFLTRESWKLIVKELKLGEDFMNAARLAYLLRWMMRSPIFSDIKDADLQNLLPMTEFKTFEAGKKIMEGGQNVSETGGMFLIAEGAVKLVPFQRSLRQTDSRAAIDQRVRMLNETSRAMVSSHSLKTLVLTPSAPTLGHSSRARKSQTGAGGPDDDDSQRRILTPSASVLGLSPTWFGKRPEQSSGSMLNLLRVKSDHQLPTTDTESPSLDHEALFQALGPSDRRFVVLLAGELFGEEGIAEDEKQRIAKASVYAVGKTTVAFIPLEALKQLGILEAIRKTTDSETGSSSAITELAQRGTDEIADRLKRAREIATTFMNYESLRKEERELQRLSALRVNKPRRESQSRLELTSSRLAFIQELHKTHIVCVTLDFHVPSYQALVVKELDVNEANKQGMGSSVLAEQVVLAQISSPFVANMIASWEEPEKLFLALEPALMGDLRTLLHWSTRLRDDKTNEKSPPLGPLGGFNVDFLVFMAACNVLALKHLYEHQVIHRDIKPDNMVLDQFGYCKLVDFGIAKRLQAGTLRTSTVAGSPKYMSPEQVQMVLHGRSGNYTNAVDWWALGMSLAELATGRLPYCDARREMSNADALYQIDSYNRDVLAAKAAAQSLSHEYSLYTSHIWLEPFRKKDEKWGMFGRFVAQLLEPDPDARLGSSTSFRGPREALVHKLFNDLRMDSIVRRKAVAPFVPEIYIADLHKVKTAYVEKGAPPRTLLDIRKREAKTAERTAAQKHPGMLKRTKPPVEHQVRESLEHVNTNNSRMSVALQSTGQAKKQEIMARDQFIRREAFKKGLGLDELDSVEGSRKEKNLVLLQRAAVLNMLHVYETGFSTRAREDVAAIRIQRCWRGSKTRGKVNSGSRKGVDELAKVKPSHVQMLGSGQNAQQRSSLTEMEVPTLAAISPKSRPSATQQLDRRVSAGLNITMSRLSIEAKMPTSYSQNLPHAVDSAERRPSGAALGNPPQTTLADEIVPVTGEGHSSSGMEKQDPSDIDTSEQKAVSVQ